ncbi:ubiquitin-like-conjugating enzyme ATG10 [Myripristis murdjan]|uniref:Ubiquitin-like-conjugating enzyme ATG10 n=1 Tax=Myripristis murdjan TaxID=586833 RepID=A0A668APJ2_9TELE|nr:ubiquitin-like-conjugating enzyme ATG10 [Myripristis murdjan]
MSWSVLDEEGFSRCCRLLVQQSQSLRDGWSWEPGQGSAEGYLRKTTLRTAAFTSRPEREPEGSGAAPEQHTAPGRAEEPSQSDLAAPAASGDADDLTGAEDDGADEDDWVCRAPAESSSRVLQYEYHVLYSCSYSVPVLYFRAFTLEGRSLSLDEVWSCVPPQYRARLQQSPWNTITQQEHPLLGQPFFLVHPCRTDELMRPVMQAAQQQLRWVNYVVTWLSMVGPLVGLEMPLSYAALSPQSPTATAAEQEPSEA